MVDQRLGITMPLALHLNVLEMLGMLVLTDLQGLRWI